MLSKFLVIVGFVSLLSVSVYEAREAAKWKHWVERNADTSAAAAKYLFSETDLVTSKGVHLRRVDLLDAVIAQAVKSATK